MKVQFGCGCLDGRFLCCPFVSMSPPSQVRPGRWKYVIWRFNSVAGVSMVTSWSLLCPDGNVTLTYRSHFVFTSMDRNLLRQYPLTNPSGGSTWYEGSLWLFLRLLCLRCWAEVHDRKVQFGCGNFYGHFLLCLVFIMSRRECDFDIQKAFCIHFDGQKFAASIFPDKSFRIELCTSNGIISCYAFNYCLLLCSCHSYYELSSGIVLQAKLTNAAFLCVLGSDVFFCVGWLQLSLDGY
jgi:hypothetical protein